MFALLLVSHLFLFNRYIKRKVTGATTPSDHVELSKSEDALFHGFSFVREPDLLMKKK